MANLILPRRFTQQPQGPVEVLHPACIAAILPGLNDSLTTPGGVKDYSNIPQQLNLEGSPTGQQFPIVNGLRTVQLHPGGGANGIASIEWPLSTAGGSLIKDELTVLWGGILQNTTTASNLFALGRDGFGLGWGARAYVDTSGTALHGGYVDYPITSGYTTSLTGLSLSTTDESRLAYRKTGNTVTVYDNKSKTKATSSGGNGSFRTSTKGLYLGGSSTGNNSHAKVGFFFAFNRALTDTEIWEYLDNPWQIFKRQPQRLYFDVTAPSTTGQLTIPRRFTQQPPSFASVDRSRFSNGIIVGAWPSNLSENVKQNNFSKGSANILETFSDGEQALYFPANDLPDHVTASNPGVTYSGTWSASTWVKPTTLAAEWVIMSSGEGSVSPYYYWMVNVTAAGAVKWYAYAGSNTSLASADGVIAAGKQYHVAVTYNSGTVTLYVNGVSVASGTSATGARTDSHNTFNLAKRPGFGGSWPFYGHIKNTVVFDGVLSPAEIFSLYASPWQIFKAPSRRLYFDVAAGGVTNYPSAADGSSFTITGSAASGISTKVGVASSGSYTIIGSSASGTVSKTSAADSDTYTITGSTANAIRSLVSAANLSSYTITGYDAQGSLPIAGDTPAAADSSAYTITGSDSLGTQSFVSAANTGSYTIIGVDALASKSKLAAAESGSYTITGSASLVTRTFASVANSGSYIVTGGIANGTYSGEPTLTLGAGSYRNRGSKKKKTYLVDGILRELTDAEVAEIVSQPIKPNEVPKKIVLEDKPKAPKKEAKEWKIESEVKTPVVKKPVFAKETLKVEDERTIVKHVVSNTVEAKIIDDTSEEEAILQFIREREAERRALAKALTWMHTLLGGR